MRRYLLRDLCGLVLFCGYAHADLPQINTSTLPNARVGTAYNQSLAAQGGNRPYTWTISVGTLPGGLNLNAASGNISGTPTTAGLSNFTVKLTDRDGQTDTQAMSITVDLALLTVTTTSLPNGTVGTAYSQALGVTGGSGGYTWTNTGGL